MALAIVLASASAVRAQTITDARRIEFTPSVDHSAVDANGVPVLQNYSLQLFVAGGAAPLQTVSLGKPAPELDGLIRLDFVSLLSSPLTLGVIYETLVEAVGPGGSSASARSNTFSFIAPCAPTISPASQSSTASGGTGGSTVTAGAGCAWTAASNVTWITVSTGAAGSGNGTVTFSVAANTAATARVGTLTIAGSTFTVTQAAAACTFTVSPLTLTVAQSGGSGTITVTTQSGCPWSSSTAATWMTLTGSGSGNGAAAYTIAANTGTTTRTATLLVAGKTMDVTQAGWTKPSAPTNLRVIR